MTRRSGVVDVDGCARRRRRARAVGVGGRRRCRHRLTWWWRRIGSRRGWGCRTRPAGCCRCRRRGWLRCGGRRLRGGGRRRLGSGGRRWRDWGCGWGGTVGAVTGGSVGVVIGRVGSAGACTDRQGELRQRDGQRWCGDRPDGGGVDAHRHGPFGRWAGVIGGLERQRAGRSADAGRQRRNVGRDGDEVRSPGGDQGTEHAGCGEVLCLDAHHAGGQRTQRRVGEQREIGQVGVGGGRLEGGHHVEDGGGVGPRRLCLCDDQRRSAGWVRLAGRRRAPRCGR